MIRGIDVRARAGARVMGDLFQLILMPWTLPRVAACDRAPAAAVTLGAFGWGLLLGAILTGKLAHDGTADVWGGDDLFRRMLGNAIAGIGMGFMVALVILFLLPQSEDLTSTSQRARRRLPLLAPWGTLLPMWVWGLLAALTNDSIRRVVGVPLAWTTLLEGWIDTPLVPIVIAALMTHRILRSIAALTRALTGDHCVHCGYLLHGLPERRCPECGHDFGPAQLRESTSTPA